MAAGQSELVKEKKLCLAALQPHILLWERKSKWWVSTFSGRGGGLGVRTSTRAINKIFNCKHSFVNKRLLLSLFRS